MAKSTQKKVASKATAKPKKPRPDFPLFPHATGRWAKKVRGKLVYFGKCADDPKGDAALSLWLDQKDDLLAGRTPRTTGDGLTIRELCNRFLTSKQHQLDTAEITKRTFEDYHATCDRLVNVYGKNRLVDDLAADDFEQLRADMSKTWGPVRLGNEIQRVRTVFKYAYDNALIDKPIRYGSSFNKPSKRVLRKKRNGNGRRMFEAGEIRKMLDAASPQLTAMILLGINAGFGNSDCGTLPLSAVDLDGGWIEYPRPKTGIERRCPLWPETVKALREVIETRPTPKDEADADLIFITKYGGSWHKAVDDNPVSKQTRKLLVELGIHRRGLGFYGLRHSFRTIADATRDFPAVRLIMGHADESIDDAYREHIGNDRLEAVVNHVRSWLFGDAAGGDQGADDAGDVQRHKGRGGLRVVG